MNKCSLIATIKHTDSLSRRHYSVCIKDLHPSYWYSCNDKTKKVIIPNNITPHTFFFAEKFDFFFQDLLKYDFAKGFCNFGHCHWV